MTFPGPPMHFAAGVAGAPPSRLAASSSGGPLAPGNLLLRFAELRLLLDGLLAASDPTGLQGDALLDAFLLAAGLCQIAEDHLHREVGFLARAARPHPDLPRILALLGPALQGTHTLLAWARQWLPSERRAARMHGRLVRLVDALGDRLMRRDADPSSGEVEGSTAPAERDLGDAPALVADLAALPRPLLRSVIRLPSCFRSFDQGPRDLHELVGRFAARWPDRGRPLVVVGLRTSGSYLAPLAASALRVAGYADVAAATLRPGQPWLFRERRSLRRTGGLALVVDDPPASGRSYEMAVRALADLGYRHGDVVLLLPLFGGAEAVPERLSPADLTPRHPALSFGH